MTTSILTWTLTLGAVELPVIGGNFTVDELNVPAVTGTFVVPDEPGLLAQLDPRTSPPPRVRIAGRRTYWQSLTVAELGDQLTADSLLTVADLSAAWAGWLVEDVSTYAGFQLNEGGVRETEMMSMSLHVREAALDRRRSTISVSVASDEALLTDWAPSSQADLDDLTAARGRLGVETVGGLVDIVMSAAIGRTLTPGFYDTDEPSALIEWTFDMSAWDMIRPILDDTDTKLRVHPDGETWTLERPPNNFTGRFPIFIPDEVLDASERYSRTGDWYDSAGLVAENVSTGLDRIAGYPAGPHSRTYRERHPRGSRVTTDMAMHLVTRTTRRGRIAQVRVPARPGIWIRQEFTYQIDFQDPIVAWTVSSVSYDIGSDLMDITGYPRD